MGNEYIDSLNNLEHMLTVLSFYIVRVSITDAIDFLFCFFFHRIQTPYISVYINDNKKNSETKSLKMNVLINYTQKDVLFRLFFEDEYLLTKTHVQAYYITLNYVSIF